MSATNQIFSWNRFTSTVKKEIAVNGRKIGLSILVIYLLYAAVLIFINVSSRGMKYFEIDPIVAYLIIALFVSMGFSQLRSKGQRVDYLATPATTAEKFLANAAIYVIGGIVVVIACICLADLTRIVLLWSQAGDGFLVPGFTALSDIASMGFYSFYNEPDLCLPQFILNCLWCASMFMLGSILWPRWTFLSTSNVIVLVWLLMRKLQRDLIWNDSITQASMNTGLDVYGLVLLNIDLIVIILCWVCGWFLFKKKDAIGRKWWK